MSRSLYREPMSADGSAVLVLLVEDIVEDVVFVGTEHE